MSAPPTRTAPPALGRGALHIVLFGMPAAGKSSLLGALAQAAQTQEHLLNGRLLDTTNGLAELQHRLYDETPRRTVEEVAPYPVVFEPFGNDGQPPGERERVEAVVIDCDGRVANDLLLRRRSLADGSREGTLAHEVEEADTLILVIDASAPPTQVDADFAEFSRFLRLFERTRGEQSEVGGLPVFLVLTKCDLLARPNDTPADWVERIEEQKRQVGQRFKDFLARRESEEGPLPFGRIDLHLWATAVKRPALAGVPAKPREPYGVAELFRQCIEHARAFHRRERRASRLLLWTVGGAGALAVGLVVLTVALLTRGREARPTALQNRVENYRYSEGQTATQRLQGSVGQLENRIAQLKEIQRDPAFSSLPAETQEYVNERLAEKVAYVAYYKLLQRARSPAEARSEDDLRKIEEALKTRGDDGLAVPREDWAGTPAARLHDERLQDAKALRRAVEDVEDWYLARKREGEKLWAFADRQPGAEASINWRAWQADAERFLNAADRPPYPETARLPDAASDTLTYGATVYHFDRVGEARAELTKVRDRLRRLRDLTTALGLGGPSEKALLVVPREPRFTVEDAQRRLQELRKAYPNFEKEFAPGSLPEAARGDVRQAARTSYESLLAGGHDAVLRQLQQARGGGKETCKAWQAVRS
ncbi:MAG TPA: GTPase domain-containing protein, partial [Gemmataceae bacterium]|nr:GTPase domain-containing protein [Gemmataceae bacterium]